MPAGNNSTQKTIKAGLVNSFQPNIIKPGEEHSLSSDDDALPLSSLGDAAN
jgi:hypothetical protein